MKKSDSNGDNNPIIFSNVFREQPIALRSFVVRKGYRLNADGQLFDAGAMDVVVPKCNINCICSIELADNTKDSEHVRLYDDSDNSEGLRAGQLSAPITNFALNEQICRISVAPKCGVVLRSAQDDVLLNCRNYDNNTANINDLDVQGAKSVDCYRLTGKSIEVGSDDVVLENRNRICASGVPNRVKCERWRKRQADEPVNIVIKPVKQIETVPVADTKEINLVATESMLNKPTSEYVRGLGLPEFVEKLSESVPIGMTLMLIFLCIILVCAVLGYMNRCRTAMAMMSAKVQSSEKRAMDAEIKKISEGLDAVGANL